MNSRVFAKLARDVHVLRKGRLDGVRSMDVPRHNMTTTTNAAMELLGLSLSSSSSLTMKQVRDAYFRASKQCHPDAMMGNNNKKCSSMDAAAQFLAVTDAYEELKTHLKNHRDQEDAEDEEDSYISKSEEEQFREACQEWLGISAEIVEESKSCPIFREWLKGKTDAAFHWTIFFMCNGGLAPKLRPPEALLSDGLMNHTPAKQPRRKRPT